MSQAEHLCIRVLAGRARGASAALEVGQRTVVGHGLDNDVVLRDASAKDVRLELRPAVEAVAVKVLEGRAELLGHAVAAPATVTLPFYVPLLIGDCALAVGAEDSPRWAEAERLLAAARGGGEDAVEGRDGPRAAWFLTRWHGLAARAPLVLPAVAAAAVGAALLVAAGAAPDWMGAPTRPDQVRQALTEAGYGSVAVNRSKDGRLRLTGMLATEGDRARLQKLVQRRGFDVELDVRTGERLAATVEDVFRANGLEAHALSLSPGMVRVDVRNAAEGEVASVRELAAREVPGLKRLTVIRTGEPPAVEPPAAEPFELIPSGPGKRVVSVVDGRVDYVATEDGSRYFPGAVLPTGHRIVRIAGQTVAVEKDGAVSELVF